MSDVPNPQVVHRWRDPTDISPLTRNRLWAWVVYCCTEEADSWEALDKHWIGRIDGGTPTAKQTIESRERRRLFYRYFQQGISPEHLRGKNGKYLIRVVHADPLQREAKALWRSWLWVLLGPEVLALDRVLKIRGKVMRRLKLVCLTPTQRVVAQFIGFKNIALDTQDLRNIADSAYNVGALASVDAIAILGCSFRIAMETMALDVAQIYLDALRWALDRFSRRWGGGSVTGTAFVALIEKRLLRRPAASPTARSLGFKVRKRRRPEPMTTSSELEGLLRSPLQSKEAYRAPPIVPLDDAMKDFFRNFKQSYLALRSHILEKLQSENPEGVITEDLLRERTKQVDDMLLGALNTHGESATAMLRLLSLGQLCGGLARIVFEIFHPEEDPDSVT